MSKISDALQQTQRWNQSAALAHLSRYVVEQDDDALPELQPEVQRNYGYYSLIDALRSPGEWDDEDRRLVRGLSALRSLEVLGQWLDKHLKEEKAGQAVHEMFCRELHGLSRKEVAAFTVEYLGNLMVGGRPTSAGTFLLRLTDKELRDAAGSTPYMSGLPLTEFVLSHAPERMPGIVDTVLAKAGKGRLSETFELLLRQNAGQYEANVLKAFGSEKQTWDRFLQVRAIYDYNPVKYRDLALSAARASLAGSGDANNHGPAAEWLVGKFGVEAIPDLVKYLKRGQEPHWSVDVVRHAATGLGAAAVPVLLAGMEHSEDSVRRAALEQQIALQDAAHDPLILQHFDTGLAPDSITRQGKGNEEANKKETQRLLDYLSLAGQWDVPRIQDSIWPLLEHKSKQVRDRSARALAKMGDAGAGKATELMGHRKADVRLAAALLLATSGTPKAMEVLESRVDAEANDDVRDQIMAGLQQAWQRQGRQVTRKDIAARIRRSADKLEDFRVDWLREDRLPALRWKEGGKLSSQELRYLLYRQSRAKEIAPDVEAAALYPLLDHGSSGDFAQSVLEGFLGSKAEAQDRWAMTVAALLGDDRIVPLLVNQIRQWVDSNRGKLAEYAVQALALLGSDAALLAVDAMSIRYRNKMKNVGRAAAEAFAAAAEAQGISPEELGDRVVPWLGFEPGRPRLVSGATGQFEIGIGVDLKLTYRDVGKNKPVKSLPKSVPAEVLAELKELAANLKEVAKAQVIRMENLLVRQRRWPVARWKGLFLAHPVLLPFAMRLVWGQYDGDGKLRASFRALEDRTLTAADDSAFALGDAGAIGIVHPLEMSDHERSLWQKHLLDYEVDPPFPQMGREVVCVPAGQENAKKYEGLAGKKLNAMTFKGRAERIGWHRGSVCDAGGIPTYMKNFPSAGTDVLLGLDGFYIGIDMYSDVTLGEVRFVRGGSVQTGSYVYDEPTKDDDSRVLAFAEVPPIVFSEVMGDLKKIAGQAAQDDD